MANIDLAATSPCPRIAGPSTWLTRHVGAGLTQAWKGQPSYDRPDKGKVGKVDMPQLQEGRHAPRRKDHERRGEVRRHGMPRIAALIQDDRTLGFYHGGIGWKRGINDLFEEIEPPRSLRGDLAS
ncbi:hypothetical protein GW17_00016601 [Ensete ventricosum]|nr:hypothetical protein GW17_00016601 [Ensete ventricosum]